MGNLLLIYLVVILGVLHLASVSLHYEDKWACEEEHNVNFCERNVTYTPFYPESGNN